MHCDVVLEVRVTHEEVALCGLDAHQERPEIRRVELEAFVEDDRELFRMRIDELADAFLEVFPMLGILSKKGNLQRRFQLSLLHEIEEEVHLSFRQVLDRRKRSEHPLAAAVDAAGSGATRDERDSVALGHDTLRLDELRTVAADHGVHLLLNDELLHQLSALGGVGGVVEQPEVDFHLLAAHEEAPGVVDLLHRQLRGGLVRAADLRLLACDR